MKVSFFLDAGPAFKRVHSLLQRFVEVRQGAHFIHCKLIISRRKMRWLNLANFQISFKKKEFVSSFVCCFCAFTVCPLPSDYCIFTLQQSPLTCTLCWPCVCLMIDCCFDSIHSSCRVLTPSSLLMVKFVNGPWRNRNERVGSWTNEYFNLWMSSIRTDLSGWDEFMPFAG